MPVQPTYPGVYVQEVPSGVRTIVGVSTSVTAFVGVAKRGPINKPVTVYNYAEYETRFGGLSADSEMSYAVRSFFLNGGSQAIIVRLARNAVAATQTLDDVSAAPALTVTALDAGSGGNDIDVLVDFDTATPDSTFNLTLRYRSEDAPTDNRVEAFTNLSMNSSHSRYVENAVNGISELATVEVIGSVAAVAGTAATGYVLAAGLAAFAGEVDATHSDFQVEVDGGDAVTISLPGPFPYSYAGLETALNTLGALNGFTCTNDNVSVPGSERLVLTSLTTGENSRINILPGITNDVSVRLTLGAANGGTTTDAAEGIRPDLTPDPSVMISSGTILAGTLTAGTFTGTITISLDGNIAQDIDYNIAGGLLGGTNTQRLADLASRIQEDVRALRPGITAYDDFTCTSAGATTLTLTTGSRGEGASIEITETTLSANLGLDTACSVPTDNYLTGGSESTFDDSQAYSVYIGSRALREGIYALESVDIFNILCLPGIPNGATERAGILADADAYCKERRAFFIIDASLNDDLPTEIQSTIVGTSLPKSDNAAVYYPWIKIPDPLNGSQPRTSAPCGAMAGIFSRTDSSRGVWKAPAGTEATITGATDLTYVLTDPENGGLNPLGVNCLRNFPVYGNIVWGARTLQGNDQLSSEYKYVPVRRTAYHIEESLYRGLKWAVFEPNDEPLWAQIRLNAGAFMQNLFRQGAFQGQKRDDAYFVKCDSETTTQNDINLGIVNIWVGFAPLKPAEFVVLYIQQIAGQVQV